LPRIAFSRLTDIVHDVNDLHYLPRLLEPTLERALGSFPVVVLTGARQTGKTTLARHVASAATRTFRTLDDLRVLEQAEREPDLLVREAERLTLDEVQRAPDLLRAVKRAVDADRRPGRFLLTGSANLLLLRTVSETLAGRAVYLRLGPLTESEKARSANVSPWSALLAAESAEQAERLLGARPARRLSWQAAALQGGYPPVLPLAPEDRARWFDGYLATYLERDLQQVATISALADFRRLVQIAALRLGGILNQADLARDAGVSRPTAHRYLGLLEVSHQVRKLPAFTAGRTPRLVKSPKLFWTDTGFAAHLAGVSDLRAEPRSGSYLENLVLADLDAWRETVAPRPEVFYWRTAGGIEVDFVLEQRSSLVPIEVKTASRAGSGDAAGVERFMAGYRRARWGIVVHTGLDVYRISARVVAAPLGRLLG
jgi:predicted AAA+ superfamily ATPase